MEGIIHRQREADVLIGQGKTAAHEPRRPGVMPACADTAARIESPFVSVPGLVTGECVQRGEFSCLEVHVNPDPGDARTDDIVGDVILNGEVSQPWGLHLVDMSLTMGNLAASSAGKRRRTRRGTPSRASVAADHLAGLSAPAPGDFRRVDGVA